MYNIVVFIITCLRENVNKYQIKEKKYFFRNLYGKIKIRIFYENTDLFKK